MPLPGNTTVFFCLDQDTMDERYREFENAVKKVYASLMNEDALAYRMNRGLFQQEEQMAILVQRVSGNCYEGDFFPHINCPTEAIFSSNWWNWMYFMLHCLKGTRA